jgi:hypothetical protein
MTNFLNPDPNSLPLTREIHFDPRDPRQKNRIRAIRERARNIGVNYHIVSVPGRGNKLVLHGPRGYVMRSLNSRYAGTARRRRTSSGRRSSTRRRS